jgi:hypothetical protein
MRKKETKLYSDDELIHKLKQIEHDIHEHYPNVRVDFSFIDESYFKKFDTKNVKKIKDFIHYMEDFFLVIQELRSRHYALIEIAEFEEQLGFLHRSFSEKS